MKEEYRPFEFILHIFQDISYIYFKIFHFRTKIQIIIQNLVVNIVGKDKFIVSYSSDFFVTEPAILTMLGGTYTGTGLPHLPHV